MHVADREIELEDAGYGVYQTVTEARSGDDYVYASTAGKAARPVLALAARGLRGPSRVFDAGAPRDRFVRPARSELVIYELHIGTFTKEGTFEAAASELLELAALGITAIEVMPIAEFPGARGWGYDGVYLSAAQSSYGGPEQFAQFVAAAHRSGLAVILDVVYNHLGASGTKAMEAFGPYFTPSIRRRGGRRSTTTTPTVTRSANGCARAPSGGCATSASTGCGSTRSTRSSTPAPSTSSRRSPGACTPSIPGAYVIAESGLNDPIVMRPQERGGWTCDAAWADDFHHSLRTLLTDERDGYYADFGRVAQLAKALHRPHVDDGSYSPFRRRRFGAPADDVAVDQFVVFSQNHDQVGNRAFGDRMPDAARPLAAFCTLLAPFMPLLFMGEEYGEQAPFQFFSNHIDKEIAEATREGRRREFASFASFEQEVPDPEDPATFERSKLTRRRDPELVAALSAADLRAQPARVRGGRRDRVRRTGRAGSAGVAARGTSFVTSPAAGSAWSVPGRRSR